MATGVEAPHAQPGAAIFRRRKTFVVSKAGQMTCVAGLSALVGGEDDGCGLAYFQEDVADELDGEWDGVVKLSLLVSPPERASAASPLPAWSCMRAES